MKKLRAKSGREEAIHMLIKIRDYQKADADEKWVAGMIKAWTSKLVQNCDTKSHARLNHSEIPHNVKVMISKFFNANKHSLAMRYLYDSCVTFKIVVDLETDSDEV